METNTGGEGSLPEEFRARAEAAAKNAEEANAKANSEAGFAYNAKLVAEEHARSISQIRGTVDADSGFIGSIKQKAEESEKAVAAAKSSVEADVQTISAFKTAAEASANGARGASDRSAIQLQAIDTILADVTNSQKTVTADAVAVTAAKATVEALVLPAQASQVQINDILAKATTDGAAVKKDEADARALVSSLTEVTETAKAAQQRVIEYENKLAEQTTLYQELRTKIDNLLPGATSAGLASAFRSQRTRFAKSQVIWLSTFIVTILLLLGAGFYGLPLTSTRAAPPAPPVAQQNATQPETTETWDALARHFVSRLPLVLPLIWLGIYAGRNYMLAIRGEEEYAFKEAVSTAFEGYKREMASITSAAGNVTPPIVSFSESVLQALTRRPGQIYEGPHDDMTPLGTVAKAVSDTAEALKAVTEKMKP